MKKIVLSLITTIAFIAVTSCNFELPKKVTVKSKASYNFSIGNIEKEIPFELDTGDTGDSSDTQGEVYDYFPGGENENVKQFLMPQTLVEIPADIGSFIGDLGFDDILADVGFNQTITVPSAIKNESEQPLDLTGISTALNNGIRFGGVINLAASPITLGGNGFDFDFISYTDGYLIINADVKKNAEVTVYFDSTTTGTATFTAGVAEIPLKGKTIHSTGMKIKFSEGIGNIYSGKISDDAKIGVASNVTVDKTNPNAPEVTVKIDPITISNSSNGLYETCTVGKGNLTVNMQVDSTWNNVGLLLKIDATEGLIIDDDTMADAISSPKVVDLKGKTVKPKDIIVTPNVDVTLKNSTINFDKKTVIKVNTDIQEFSELTARIGNKESLTVAENKELPSSITNFIKEIDFNECGLTGSFVNTLPAGNDILLSSESGFFGITGGSSYTLSSGTIATTDISITSKNHTTKIGEGAGEYKTIDFNALVKIPGATTENPDLITLKNVVSGKEYKVQLELQLKLDWTSFKIKTTPMSDNLPININFNSMMENIDTTGTLAGKVRIPSIPVYVYAVRPDNNAFKDAVFAGTLKAQYGTVDSATQEIVPVANIEPVIFMDEKDNQDMKIVPEPDLKLTLSEKNPEEMTVMANLDYTEMSVPKVDFADLIQSEDIPEDAKLYISYENLRITDGSSKEYMVITRDANNESNGSDAITIKAMIVLPLQLEATEDISIDVLEFAGLTPEGDLFGRTEDSSMENVDEIMGLLDSVELKYNFAKFPIYSTTPIGFEIDLGGGVKRLDSQKGSIGISKDNLRYMLESTNFQPSVVMSLPENTIFSIPRALEINVNLSLTINTDGEVVLFGGNE